jgi:hypothetical protein
VARVVGAAGGDAVRQSREELPRAAHELSSMPTSPRPLPEEDASLIRKAVPQPCHWLAGAEGECRTAKELDRLPDEYFVFHDFHERRPDGNRAAWNIDHIVVGPTGVFVIDSKNPAASTIRDTEHSRATKDRVKQTVRQTMQVREWLVQAEMPTSTLWVQSVVVFAKKNVYVHATEENHTWVLPLRMLLARIKDQNRYLTRLDVARIQKSLAQKRALTPPHA